MSPRRQLGFAGGTVLDSTGYPQADANLIVWMDEVACTGTEQGLAQCPIREWGNTDCWRVPRVDAAVRCGTPPAEPMAPFMPMARSPPPPPFYGEPPEAAVVPLLLPAPPAAPFACEGTGAWPERRSSCAVQCSSYGIGCAAGACLYRLGPGVSRLYKSLQAP